LFDFLGANETLTLVYNVTVRDAAGNTATQPVTFTVMGAAEPAPLAAMMASTATLEGTIKVSPPATDTHNGGGDDDLLSLLGGPDGSSALASLFDGHPSGSMEYGADFADIHGHAIDSFALAFAAHGDHFI
jgi:hypothetical protein